MHIVSHFLFYSFKSRRINHFLCILVAYHASHVRHDSFTCDMTQKSIHVWHTMQSNVTLSYECVYVYICIYMVTHLMYCSSQRRRMNFICFVSLYVRHDLLKYLRMPYDVFKCDTFVCVCVCIYINICIFLLLISCSSKSRRMNFLYCDFSRAA